MEASKIVQGILISVAATCFGWFLIHQVPTNKPAPLVQPIIIPAPAPDADKDKHRPHHPHLPHIRPWGEEKQVGKIVAGGPLGPDGKTEVTCDLPVSERKHNVGGRDGAGLCVFTSIMHAARYQSELRLLNFQDQMRQEPGGGYPQKVDAMIKKYGPGTQYVQYEGNSPEILKTAMKTGRMPGVTYNGHDVHYGGSIAHMVSLVAYDEAHDLACILDNNFVGENELVWLSCNEFLKRWKGGGQGWAIVLLAAPPPPVPKN
jgi:hypothetical protein